MAEERVQRRLAAILVADVVGYSRLIEADEEGTRTRIRSLHAEVIDPRIEADGGRIVKTSGDGILVEFGSVVDAVRNALAIQEAMSGRDSNLPEDSRIRFRVGINVGDVIVEGDDIHGEGVNVAARLEGLCEPGEVYVSTAVHDQVEGKLAVTFENLGEQTLKNISKPTRVYRVSISPEEATVRSEEATGVPSLPDKPSIAVLPFENMSGDPEQEYFADGIAEDIITALSRFNWFFVIARNSSFSYKGTSPDIRQVASELGVQYVLEGSVRKAGNRVRITAQLIDATTGRHVWAERYDRELDDIFAVQDEITGAITGAVAPSFVAAEAKRAARKAPGQRGSGRSTCARTGRTGPWRWAWRPTPSPQTATWPSTSESRPTAGVSTTPSTPWARRARWRRHSRQHGPNRAYWRCRRHVSRSRRRWKRTATSRPRVRRHPTETPRRGNARSGDQESAEHLA